jgi:hypothetical protein
MFETMMKSLATNFFVKFSRFRKPMDPIDYRTVIGNAQRILIGLPAPMENERLHNLQQKLNSCFPSSRKEYLISDSFPEEHRLLLQADQSDSVHLVSKKDIGFFRTLKKHILQLLRSKHFDLILDFNPTFDITFAHAFRTIGAPVIAGLFMDSPSDIFYNLLIKVSDVRSYEDSLFQCLGQLK